MQLLGHARYAAKIAQGAHLAPPYDRGRLRRLLWGFALPFGIVRATFRDRAARARWLRWSAVQLVILLGVGIRIGLARSDLGERGRHMSVTDVVAFATACYAAITVLEWILIALSRDFHDALSQMAANVTGVVAEPLAGPPRIRLDFRWLWTKGKRRLRGALMLATALPVLAVASAIPLAGEAIYLTLMTAWTAYWLAVFAMGGSFIAWEEHADDDPWFVRVFATAGQVPVVGIPPRLYARFLSWATRSVAPVCGAFERDPWTAWGLALARTLAGVPGLYLFMRPAFSVAATHAILVQRASLLPPSSSPPPLSPAPLPLPVAPYPPR